MDRGRKLQLVLYALAARQRHGQPDTHVDSCCWFVEMGSHHRGAEVDSAGERRLLEVVDVMVSGIRGGVYPAHPGDEGFFGWDSCGYCAYDRVCPAARGEQWQRLREDENVKPYADTGRPDDHHRRRAGEPVTAARREPADQAARDSIRDQHDRTLFVEAGAGTDKTTALAARVVEMVATGHLPNLAGLAAITFTENAAAELRNRIREALEQAGRGEHNRRTYDAAPAARCAAAATQPSSTTPRSPRCTASRPASSPTYRGKPACCPGSR